MSIDDLLPELKDDQWLSSLTKEQAQHYAHSWQEQIELREELLSLPAYGTGGDARQEMQREVTQFQYALKRLLDYEDKR